MFLFMEFKIMIFSLLIFLISESHSSSTITKQCPCSNDDFTQKRSVPYKLKLKEQIYTGNLKVTTEKCSSLDASHTQVGGDVKIDYDGIETLDDNFIICSQATATNKQQKRK